MTVHTAAAGPPYQGYEYQFLGTVWVALDLTIVKHHCDSIVVEPASGEDIEANLQVDSERATSQVGLPIEGGPVEIQIKLRRSGHWTEATFKEIVQGKAPKASSRGPERRPRPLKQLQDSADLRFLLLTNAQVKADALSCFVVDEIGQRSEASTVPGCKDGDPSNTVADRITILPERTPDLLKQEAFEILRRHAHVPPTKCAACLKDLENCVRDRLLEKRDPNWSVDEIQEVIRTHGGFPTLTVGDQFIPPNNFDVLKAHVAEHHSLVLTGPPGSGKTTVAQVLVHDYRMDENPYEVVPREAGVAAIRQLLDKPDRHLFFIEDPWGQYQLSGDFDRWTTDLPKLLARANRDKKFVITSRTGVKHQAIGGGTSVELDAAEIAVTEGNYDGKLRWDILLTHLKECEPWQRDLAARERGRIINRLVVPLSLKLFATKLRRAASEEAFDIDETIRTCNIEAVAQDTASEIEHLGRPAIAGAVLLWAVAMGRRTIRSEQLGSIRRHSKDAGSPDCEPERVFKFLAETGRGTDREEGFELHPSVLEGLELLNRQHQELADDVLSAMLTGLATAGDVEFIRQLVSRLRDRKLPIPDSVQECLNRYLISRIFASESKYRIQGAFFDVERWCTSDDPVTLLVRALTNKGRKLGFETWEPPQYSKEQIAQIAKSDEARRCAVKFVQGVLPFASSTQIFRPSQLIDFFKLFNWDLSSEFYTAAEEGLNMGESNVGVLVEGALTCECPRYEEMIEAAAKAEDAAAKYCEEHKEEWRKADQAELDAAYASHVHEQPGEQFYPSHSAFEAIVRVRRQAEGYQWILDHPHRDSLLSGWAEAIDKKCTVEELRALFKACGDDQREVMRAIRKAKKGEMVEEVVQHLKTGNVDQCSECLETLCEIVTDDDWQCAMTQAVDGLSFARCTAIANSALALSKREDEHAAKLKQLLDVTLDQPQREALLACHEQPATSDGNEPSLTEIDTEGLQTLRSLATDAETDTLAAQAVAALVRRDEDVSEFLPRLTGSQDVSVRAYAFQLMALDLEKNSQELFDGLRDSEYHCRRAAMETLSEFNTDAAQQAVIAMGDDLSAPVRAACAEIIGAKHWGEGQPMLVRRLADRRDGSEDVGQRRTPNFHVARQAARSLRAFSTIDQATQSAIVDFLGERDRGRDDPGVYYHLLDTLGRIGDKQTLEILQRFLTDEWYMHGHENEGFPLRYAAAWAIAEALWHDPSRSENIKPSVIFGGAAHHDGRLAGPCLCILGALGDKAQIQVAQLIESGTLSPNRAALLMASLKTSEHAVPPQLNEALAGTPTFRVLGLADDERPENEQDWSEFLQQDVQAAEWIEEVQKPEDVNPSVRFALYWLFDRRVKARLDWRDLRSRDLAEPLPVLTMRSMFGGE